MRTKKSLKHHLQKAIFGCFFALIALFGSFFATTPVFADPVESTPITESTPATTEAAPATSDDCKSQLGAIGWLVCPTTGVISKAADKLYEWIENSLVINPISTEDGSPIYEIWKYCRGITNIVFIIFLLIIVYSQITGLGINNYGIKKSLPKLIVAAVLVNLSFVICSLAVDVSNIVGQSLRGVFASVEEASVVASAGSLPKVSFAGLFASIAGGGALAIGATVIAFETGAIWMLIPVVLGALVAIASGLITIALRQAVVALLIMISPLAFVTYILPNTEGLFQKWKKLLTRMLVFYPAFSLLFGASHLAGWAIIAGAKSGFAILLGVAVQIFPLFFSWSLMKMSGTLLGTINDKMRGFAARPLATNRAWADSRRAQTRAYNLNYGKTPYMRLQRYLDNRRNLHASTTDSLNKLRSNEATIYTQHKIGAGYDGTKATEANKGNLKPNKYTRIAKDLSNSSLASTVATLDTAHTISNYGNYYLSAKTRQAVELAGKNQAALADIKSRDRDYLRATTGAQNYLEYHRAQMLTENDEEADFGFMVNEYLDANFNKDANPESMQKYRHYLVTSAGGLGEAGTTRVLGKIIAKAASVESNQRRDINIIANKFPPDKRSFRNMLVGYYVDDDGYATDKEGKRIEAVRGELLANSPEQLVMWDNFDENGAYFDWYDTNGKFVTRIHKTDKSAIKELLSNFDAPINDPINNLYGLLAGVKEDPSRELTGHIGLDAYRTTVGRAILSAPFKEKNACFSPMVAEMIKKGYIQNYAQENLAYLDSLNKATKPGAFNTQDADAIQALSFMMDPRNWEQAFPTDLIRGYRNVNGEEIYGIRYDENGDKIKVPAKDATREELMERVKEKYIFPAAHKMASMMSRQTPNTSDNQKVGTAEQWKKFKNVFDTQWNTADLPEDPYQQYGDTREMARDIQQKLYTVDEHGNKHMVSVKGKKNDNQNIPTHVNHHVVVEDMYINCNNDPDAFARDFAEYCDNYAELARASRDFQDYIAAHAYLVTAEELHDFAIELLDSYTNLD